MKPEHIIYLKNRLKNIDEIAKDRIESMNNCIYNLYFQDINSFFTNDYISMEIKHKEEQLEKYIEMVENEKRNIICLINENKEPVFGKLSAYEIRQLKIRFIKYLRKRKLRFKSVHSSINKLPEIYE